MLKGQGKLNFLNVQLQISGWMVLIQNRVFFFGEQIIYVSRKNYIDKY